MLSGPYKPKTEDAEKKSKEANKTLSETFAASTFDYLSTVFSKPETTRSLAQARKQEDRRRTIETLFTTNMDEGLKMIVTWVDTMSKLMPEIQLLSSVVQNVALYPTGVKNSEIIATRIKLPDSKAYFFAEIEKLASSDTVKVGTTSYCLDCYFTHSRESYNAAQSNIHSISLPHLCPTCRGEGVLHQITLDFPRGLHQFILPQTNWLQEMIVGHTVSQLPSTSRVYVHKMLHQVINGSPSKGVEVDVILVTNDERLFLIEVTNQTDADNILREFIRKRDYYRKTGLNLAVIN
ncbi:MAG: hypothetical protein ACRDF4_09485 [Rhabdochlamydiaceae bacterium]